MVKDRPPGATASEVCRLYLSFCKWDAIVSQSECPTPIIQSKLWTPTLKWASHGYNQSALMECWEAQCQVLCISEVALCHSWLKGPHLLVTLRWRILPFRILYAVRTWASKAHSFVACYCLSSTSKNLWAMSRCKHTWALLMLKHLKEHSSPSLVGL